MKPVINIIFIISLSLLAFEVLGQISFTLPNKLDSKGESFKLLLQNNGQAVNNSYLNVAISIDGRTIYQATTRPITLNSGINQLTNDLVQPIQVELDELSLVPAGEKVIYDVKLIQENKIISRERKTITLNLDQERNTGQKSLNVADKFNIQGSFNLLGQLSDRQGEGSTVPKNYLRSDGRATLSFSHLPIDLSYLLTSEQNAFNQNMNRATARLNIPLLKQNLKEVVDRRIEEAGREEHNPSESQLRLYKIEKVKDIYPTYMEWKEHFSSTKGREEVILVQRFLSVKALKKSPSTTKNIRRHSTLSSKQNLSNSEKEELEILTLLVHEIDKVSKEVKHMQSTLSRPIEELVDGYHLIQEAEDFMNNLSIDDYKSENSRFNPYTYLSKAEKLLNAFQSVTIGTSAPYFSKMTLSGLMVDGIQLEINPGKFYFSGVYGRSTKETFNPNYSTPDLTLSQRTLGFKTGYGGSGESHLHVSFVQVSDSDSPLLQSSGITKQNNRLLGLEGMISLLDNNLTIQGELVGSLFTTDSDATTLDNNNKKEIPLRILYPKANSTSSFDHAYSLDAKWRSQSLGLNVSGNLERLNPRYFSLGAPTLLSNVLRWRMDVRKSLMRNKIQVGINAARDNNSLNPLLSSITSNTESFGGDLTIAFPNLPQIYASYAPFAQNSLINETGVEQFSDTKVTILNIAYPYKLIKGISASTNVGYTHQSLASNIEGANSKNTTYTIAQNINYKDLGVNASLTHSPDQIIGENRIDLSTLAINVAYNLGNIRSSLGCQVLRVTDQEMKTGYQANIDYKVSDNISMTFRANRNLYSSYSINPSFKEYYIQSGLTVLFGTERKDEPKERQTTATKTEYSSKEKDLSKDDRKKQKKENSEKKVIPNQNEVKKIEKEFDVHPAIDQIEELKSSNTSKHFKVLFSVEKYPDKNFVSISTLGPVYSEKVGPQYFYFVGHSISEIDARKLLKEVVGMGYPDAKLLEFDKGRKVRDIPYTDSKRKKVTERIKKVESSDKVTFHILFRVLDNPNEKFDDLKALGTLYRETFDDKGNSRYLIGKMETISEAKQLLKLVKERGYKASVIAEYKNGVLHGIH